MYLTQEERIVRVSVNLPLFQFFDYRLPNALWCMHPEQAFWIGRRVLIHFRNRETIGIITAIITASDSPRVTLKEIHAVDMDSPHVSNWMLQLAYFCQERYFMACHGYLFLYYPTQLRQLKRGQASAKDRFKVSCPPALLQEKPALNLVDRFQPLFELTAEQHTAVTHCTQKLGQSAYYLLFGITGSGKTEVYLHIIVQTLKRFPQGQVLLLVPEVVLTPQLEQWVRTRFQIQAKNPEIVCLHSHLTPQKRFLNWYYAATGKAQIVIGTRSAIFTPLPHLACMIIDEEHDGSYRQIEDVRYVTRDVAHQRARLCQVPLILGSATPSLEVWHAAQNGFYQRIDLTMRPIKTAALPQINLIDTRPLFMKDGLSELLIHKIKQALLKKQQCLLFINRRGFAPVIYCQSCGWISTCPRCQGVRLVYHQTDGYLHCHHCGHREIVPRHCPECEQTTLKPVGQGTQRIESVLATYFSDKKIARIDSDTVRLKGVWEQIRKEIANQTIDILVGTQILTKGHDFPNMNFIGVINADSGLYSSDFRAEEQLFAQLLQVAGRAGRAQEVGEVWIQTAFPDHPLFYALRKHDYVMQATRLLQERQWMQLPPFSHQAMILLSGQQIKAIWQAIEEIGQLLDVTQKIWAESETITIFDPVLMKMPHKKYVAQAYILTQATSRYNLNCFLKQIFGKIDPICIRNEKIEWKIIFNPVYY